MATDPHSEKFLIWFTGFYEGEGSVSNGKSNRNRIILSVSQNDRTPLDLAMQRWGGKVVERIRQSPASDKMCYGHEWRISGKHAMSVINEILPHMLVPLKRVQINNVLQKQSEPWESRFTCNFCSKDFADPSGRRRHEKIEHINKGTLHVCQHCDLTYTSKDTLHRHIKLKHKPNASPSPPSLLKGRETGEGQDNQIAGNS